MRLWEIQAFNDGSWIRRFLGSLAISDLMILKLRSWQNLSLEPITSPFSLTSPTSNNPPLRHPSHLKRPNGYLPPRASLTLLRYPSLGNPPLQCPDYQLLEETNKQTWFLR